MLFAATLIPVDAQEAFIIDDLHVSMEVHEDGGIDITETYVLNLQKQSMDFFVISQPPRYGVVCGWKAGKEELLFSGQ